jgi:hypothetical protein
VSGAAKAAIKVAGGQTISSALPASAFAGYDLGEFARRGSKPIHFPIARNERE